MAVHEETAAEGPYFDELAVGQTFTAAPSVTLTDGLAAVHQSIVGDRMRLPLDANLSREVTGRIMANPALVWNVAIGQSTLVTQQVVANLYYRGLAFRRAPSIGDTITTVTEVTSLRRNRPRPDRRPTGLAELRIASTDQLGRVVLDFRRCAMLPLRNNSAPEYESASASASGESTSDSSVSSRQVFDDVARDWDLAAYRSRTSAPGPPQAGTVVRVVGGDVVSSAPELARLTLNIANVHHDEHAAGGRRLVYGGHTIAIALSQATRVWPGLVSVLAWESCNHLAPVHEGDTLRSRITVEASESIADGALLTLRSVVEATDTSGSTPQAVLDWRFVALF
jgi:acyl dehydratase